MYKQQCSRISLVTLILCLCLGSMVVLPISKLVNVSMVFEIDVENNIQNDQTSLDEEFLIAIVDGPQIECQTSSKTRSMNLVNPPPNLVPESPPPENS